MVFWIIAALAITATCSFCIFAIFSYIAIPGHEDERGFRAGESMRHPGPEQLVRDLRPAMETENS